jgi:hypothetical protein
MNLDPTFKFYRKSYIVSPQLGWKKENLVLSFLPSSLNPLTHPTLGGKGVGETAQWGELGSYACHPTTSDS